MFNSGKPSMLDNNLLKTSLKEDSYQSNSDLAIKGKMHHIQLYVNILRNLENNQRTFNLTRQASTASTICNCQPKRN